MRENRMRRKPEVSDGRSIRVGLVGPKPRPEGVGDGQPVNNPVLPGWSEGGTRPQRSASWWSEVPSVRSGEGGREIRCRSRARDGGAFGPEVTGVGAKKSL